MLGFRIQYDAHGFLDRTWYKFHKGGMETRVSPAYRKCVITAFGRYGVSLGRSKACAFAVDYG